MQVPGLDELEEAVARAVDELRRLRTESAELRGLLRDVGKEMDDLAGRVKSIESGRKLDARTAKKIKERVDSIIRRLP